MVIASGRLLAVGIANSPVTIPDGVIRPILFASDSVNQMFPSGAGRDSGGTTTGVVGMNGEMAPNAVIRPTILLSKSVNQTFPSGPFVIPARLLKDGTGNSETVPDGVIRPILFALDSVNQRFHPHRC